MFLAPSAPQVFGPYDGDFDPFDDDEDAVVLITFGSFLSEKIILTFSTWPLRIRTPKPGHLSDGRPRARRRRLIASQAAGTWRKSLISCDVVTPSAAAVGAISQPDCSS